MVLSGHVNPEHQCILNHSGLSGYVAYKKSQRQKAFCFVLFSNPSLSELYPVNSGLYINGSNN